MSIVTDALPQTTFVSDARYMTQKALVSSLYSERGHILHCLN